MIEFFVASLDGLTFGLLSILNLDIMSFILDCASSIIADPSDTKTTPAIIKPVNPAIIEPVNLDAFNLVRMDVFSEISVDNAAKGRFILV